MINNDFQNGYAAGVASNGALLAGVDDVQLNNTTIVDSEGIAKIVADATPTQGSSNLALSGGIYTAIKAVKTLRPMKSSWCGGNITTAQAVDLMFEDGVQEGEGYLGGVSWSDLSTLGLGNAEVKAFVINDWIIQFELTSSDTSPYAWFYNSASGTWRSYLPVVDDLQSTSTTEALSANMGKHLSEMIDNSGKNAYNYINQMADYLFEVQYSTKNIDYEYANEYFHNLPEAENTFMGACTGIYKDGKVLRQFDYYYDNNVEFVVRRVSDEEAANYVTNGQGIHASVGVASGVKELTKEVVESGSYHSKLKLVPFNVVDGINDAGLYIQVNVVPKNHNGAEITYDINPSASVECASSMIPRSILDYCATFEDVENFFNNTHIYSVNGFSFGFHYLIVINNVWKVIELTSDGHVTVTEGTQRNQMPAGVMTNFRTTDLTFSNNEIDWNTIEQYGIGVERYEIAQTAFAESDPSSLEELRSALMYSHLYTDTPQTWQTELSGSEVNGSHLLTVQDIKAGSYAAEVIQMLLTEKSNYETATREVNNGVWITVHSAIYDLANKSLNLAVQERMDTQFNISLSEWTAKELKFSNLTASSWTSDTTYTGYSYKCDLACSGVTSNDIAEVIFNPTEAISGNYAPVCNTNANTVTIYSKVDTSITIPLVVVRK